MKRLETHVIPSILLVLLLSSVSVSAQTETAKVGNSSGATVTVCASGERVRFTAPPSVVQLRLEVYDSTGKKLFDNEVRGGNVLDWLLQDGQGQSLADDAYVCVVTTKTLAGRLSQRIGSVTVEKASVTVQPADPSHMTAQQAQAIGPIEENASLTVLKEDDNPTTTVIAHNGQDGQITRGRGALSFRIGDFFSGNDTEQMRLTPEGNLGIGITHPQARLDVDGLIRASQGIIFPDGSVQYSAATKTYGAKSSLPDPSFQSIQSRKKSSGGQDHIDVLGTGTLNHIAKWKETGGNGILGDTGIFETDGGNVGIGMTNPFTKLDVNGAVNIGGSNLYLGGSLRFTDNVGAGYTNFVALNGNLTNFDGVNYEQLNLYNPGGDKAIHLAQTADGSQIASIGGAGNTTLSLQPSGGNVGIGATVPNTKLTVWTSGLGVAEGIRINNPVGFVGNNNGASLVFSQDRSPSENFVNATIEGAQELANSSADGYLAFRTRSGSFVAEKMRITSTGKVGIGTNAPQATLDVTGTGASNMALRISNGGLDVTGLGPSNIALRIAGGGIQVAGAGVGASTPVFIHQATAASLAASGCIIDGTRFFWCTAIDHPLTNGDPNAILIVTPTFLPNSSPPPFSSVFVFYSTRINQWLIATIHNDTIFEATSFNVLVVKR